MNIYDEFFSIIKKLNEANVQYAVVEETEYGLTCIASREDLSCIEIELTGKGPDP
ncbi:hypothetical protein ES705_33725 [subsurface metagenome]